MNSADGKSLMRGLVVLSPSPSGDVLDLDPVVMLVLCLCMEGFSLLCEINTPDNICVGMLHPCGAQLLHLYKSR